LLRNSYLKKAKISKQVGKRVILAPGYNLTMATSIENLRFVLELAHDKYQCYVLKDKELNA